MGSGDTKTTCLLGGGCLRLILLTFFIHGHVGYVIFENMKQSISSVLDTEGK